MLYWYCIETYWRVDCLMNSLTSGKFDSLLIQKALILLGRSSLPISLWVKRREWWRNSKNRAGYLSNTAWYNASNTVQSLPPLNANEISSNLQWEYIPYHQCYCDIYMKHTRIHSTILRTVKWWKFGRRKYSELTNNSFLNSVLIKQSSKQVFGVGQSFIRNSNIITDCQIVNDFPIENVQ